MGRNAHERGSGSPRRRLGPVTGRSAVSTLRPPKWLLADGEAAFYDAGYLHYIPTCKFR
jgi:hypothetical protein